ncbi:hypothetical protein D3C71_1019120 [compost metagenome]
MPPNGRNGSSTGTEPVASSRCSQVMRSVPPSSAAPAISTVLPSTIVAQPLISCAPFFFSSALTPPVSFLTIPAFHATVLARSSDGACTLIPSGEVPAA